MSNKFQFKDVYTIRITGDDRRVFEHALRKWPDLADADGKVNVAALMRELFRDWEAWDNVYRGKAALMIYEAALTRKYVQEIAGLLGVKVDGVLEDFAFEKWAEEYHATKKAYDLLSK